MIDGAELESYLQRYMEQHAALSPFFQGTITAVSALSLGFAVTVVPAGDDPTLSTGITGTCLIAGFTPAVGMVVECFRRTSTAFYVLWQVA